MLCKMFYKRCSTIQLNICTIEWDDDVPSHLKSEWCTFFQGLFGMQKIVFKRLIRPGKVIGDQTLVISSESSEKTFGACHVPM